MSLRVGIIGAGAIGKEHAKRLYGKLSNSTVVAINDVNAEGAKEFIAAEMPDVKFYESGHDLIKADNVDAILVASWGPTHYEFVMGAIEAGKPVFCEKPLATDQEDAKKIVEAEIKFGKKLVQVGFMRRYDLGYKMLKAHIDNGNLGEPLMVHSAHRNPEVPTMYKEDMPFHDTFIHEIDVLRWLVNDDYDTVQVLIPKQTKNTHSELQDPLMVILKTKTGILLDTEIFVNCKYGYDIQCSVVGETGIANLPEPTSLTLRSEAKLSNEILMDWKDRFVDSYDVELQDWIDATLKGEVNGPTAWDGYFAAVTADACAKARVTGEVVSIGTGDTPDFYK